MIERMGGWRIGDKARVNDSNAPMPWGATSPPRTEPTIWKIKSFQRGMLDEMVELEREGNSSHVVPIEDLVRLDVIERLGEVADE